MRLATWTLRLAAVAVAGVLTIATSADAQRGDSRYFSQRTFDNRVEAWDELDVRRIDPRADSVLMPVGRREGQHTAIRFRVLDDQVFIRRLVVIYGNGQSQEIPFRRALGAGEMSDVIDLEGDRRFIQEVRVFYRPEPAWRSGNRGARLALLGDRLPGRPAAPPPPPLVRDIPRGWVLFGVQQAEFGGDRDIIRVGREKGRFDKIALRVRDNDVFVRNIRINYSRGDSQDYAVNQMIPQGSRTSEIVLQRDRFIDTIELTYGSRPGSSRRATIELYGEYAQGFAGEGGGYRQEGGGWQLIGAQSASMFRSDNDVFEIGQQFGTFTKLRLQARRNNVDVRHVTVIYENGYRQDLPINTVLRAGDTSAVIDIPGRGRFLKSVTINMKSQPSLRGDGVIELWGQH
jgi:hypothetical protein